MYLKEGVTGATDLERAKRFVNFNKSVSFSPSSSSSFSSSPPSLKWHASSYSLNKCRHSGEVFVFRLSCMYNPFSHSLSVASCCQFIVHGSVELNKNLIKATTVLLKQT